MREMHIFCKYSNKRRIFPYTSVKLKNALQYITHNFHGIFQSASFTSENKFPRIPESMWTRHPTKEFSAKIVPTYKSS